MGLGALVAGRIARAPVEPFIRCLRANMRHAGALRIDHVVGLLRQFWVPNGSDATEGHYIANALDELLSLLTLESQRNRCMIIGEDLGTIPDDFRARLAVRGVLSYRVFYFEKHWQGDGSFLPPGEYPQDSLVTLSTHDLPTFAGYCLRRDLRIRTELGLFSTEDIEQAQDAERSRDIERLRQALVETGLLGSEAQLSCDAAPSDDVVAAVHRFLAQTPARAVSVQLED